MDLPLERAFRAARPIIIGCAIIIVCGILSIRTGIPCLCQEVGRSYGLSGRAPTSIFSCRNSTTRTHFFGPVCAEFSTDFVVRG